MAVRQKNKNKKKAGIKTGDTVIVVTGKDAGTRGRVIAVLPEKNRVLVEGVNFVKKHARRTREDRQGGIHELEASIDLSNAMLVCPKCKQPTRVGQITLADDSKVRSCKKCGEVVE
jgi:large subunit ribosomal protein L24